MLAPSSAPTAAAVAAPSSDTHVEVKEQLDPELEKLLLTNIKHGLTDDEVQQRLIQFGTNGNDSIQLISHCINLHCYNSFRNSGKEDKSMVKISLIFPWPNLLFAGNSNDNCRCIERLYRHGNLDCSLGD